MVGHTSTPIKTRPWQKVTLVIFGILLTFILLEVALRLSGFIILSLQEHRNIVSIRQRGEYRIMCLGESTTQNQYPRFLEEVLNNCNLGIKFSVIDKGVGGINTATVVSGLEFNLDKYHPDIVVAMIGINDLGEHLPYEAISDSKIILFLRSFRTYKLARLVWLHLTTKAHIKKQIALLMPGLIRAYAEEINPISNMDSFKKNAYAGVKWLCIDRDEIPRAEKVFKKAIEINPYNVGAYVTMGRLYSGAGKISLAQKIFKRAIDINPRDYGGYAGLGWIYRTQGKFSLAEEAFKKAEKLNPQSDEQYAALYALYQEMGKLKLAKKYERKMERLRLNYYNPVTVDNYLKLKEILDRRGIRLVCVQYPMRSIEPLKKIFQGREGIIFVDNEKIFKDALKMAGYKEYFRDMFGGDFGHCTVKGNRLLAQNIANTILNEVFNQ